MAKTIEKGNIYYFYRPKVEAESAKDVQRFYILMDQEELYRLIIIGTKKLPDDPRGSSSIVRNWAWIRAITKDRSTIEDILGGGEYETKTKGTQHLPPAAPLGEGRYAIVEYGGHTELAYKLKREQSDEIENIFGLKKEASLAIAVKNPEVHVKGFP